MDIRYNEAKEIPMDQKGEVNSGYYAVDDTSLRDTHVHSINGSTEKGLADPFVRPRAKQACDKCRLKKCAVNPLPPSPTRGSHKLVHWGEFLATV